MEENNLLSLTVLRGLLDDNLFSAFYAARENGDERYACSLYGAFLNTLYSEGAETNFMQYVCNAVLYDESSSMFFRECEGL